MLVAGQRVVVQLTRPGNASAVTNVFTPGRGRNVDYTHPAYGGDRRLWVSRRWLTTSKGTSSGWCPSSLVWGATAAQDTRQKRKED
jgi:hypothetical protein